MGFLFIGRLFCYLTLNMLVKIFLLFTFVYGFECGKYTVTEEVYLDFKVKNYDGEKYSGRVVVALFGQTAPITCLNFAKLAQGYKKGGKNMAYFNTTVHRVVQDFVIQMGDITQGDGTGGVSIYGDTFADEAFIISHAVPGVISMANHGKDTNNSQFFILLTKARWLDGNHVA